DAAREGHRLRRRAARRRQRRRRVRRHRAHARDVQGERASRAAASARAGCPGGKRGHGWPRADAPRRQGAALLPAWRSADLAIQASYFVTAVLFIMGLKRMSSPVTARSGILWAGAGMAVATAITFLYPSMTNYGLIVPAMLIGSVLAWWSGKRVAMTDMPQMIALYNGMGGGAAAAIAAVELYGGNEHNVVHLTMATIGGFIGAVSFSGSLIAFAKLQGLITKSVRFGGQRFLNLAILLATVALGVMVITGLH